MILSGENYALNNATNNILFNKTKKNITNEKQSTILNIDNKTFSINVINIINSNEIIFITVEDISFKENSTNTLLNEYILISTIILITLILVFNLLLKKPMGRIDQISKSLEIIGEGRFIYAQRILRQSKRRRVYDELDNIHRVAYTLTKQLEKMHFDLKQSNRQLKTNVAEMSFLADHDTLTGLFNRRRFNKELQRAHQKKEPFMLISMDMNHFKLVNDSLGHATGDTLLQNFAETLNTTIINKGIIGRMGGDEFSVIFHGNEAELNSIIKCFVKKLNLIVVDENIPFKVSSSIGVARFPHDTSSLQELTVFSDAAMYENKRFKSSDFNYYSGNETLIKEEKESQYWSKVISDALNTNMIRPLFQPILNLKNKEIYSYEVLGRIKQQDNLLSPALYMDHLEKNRLIINFDKIIIDRALRHSYKNPKKEKLMINLSYYTIAAPNMENYIIDCCNKYQYPPQKITFEITERVEVSDITMANNFINNLKKHGFSIALDDFGAGFSSFFYLTELPIDYLKIDKKITTGLINNPTDHHIIHSIIILAKRLDIKIIAEGIDSLELLKIVSHYEIDFIQGYFLSKPLAQPALEQDIRTVARG